ncbi:CubicO group peptidase (beta-lactamase class C family) [Pseudoduganella flava]|uniref:CubicO group peptidase (Beta-lactamase class C family) n=1 Tax=Pseudoduganella flava TaxID=871742 RepID=A0A562PJH9_9BURK|nr:serine hydrolase domain-containing protein [Pseudoduganella flava]QGZ42056.1 serine hydrolase [Pseudoduganella flava]TWI44483.1 CubicO group peptidase (beta-lactamase class C family) [Pseudoduganella flava]
MHLDTAIENALARQRIVGAVVLVARDGEIVYRRAAGLADREQGVPMREDALFRLSSVTKPFVAAAALKLADDGTIDLSAPVTEWLPHFRPRLPDGTAPDIALHQLLSHTAGLSYSFQEPQGPYRKAGVSDGLDQPGLTLEENLARIASVPLAFAPGTRWRYSVATDVLGAVLEKATGMPLPEIVRREVTGSLGIRETAFHVIDESRLVVPYYDHKPAPARMADIQAVRFMDGEATFAQQRIFDPASYPSGGAGMAGTADDVMRFLLSLRTSNRAILAAATVDRTGPQAMTQGPGWGFGYLGAVLAHPKEAHSPQSPGTIQWGGAYGHYWFLDPIADLVVVQLTNTAFEGMAGMFPRDVRNAAYKDFIRS